MGKNNKEEYSVHELVFGQLRGYPWWPGYIAHREPSGEYKVVFFGDFTYALLNAKKIRPFEGSSRKFDKKNQKLTQAIKSAIRVLNKESSIKQETDAVLLPVPIVTVRPKPIPDKTKKIKKPEARPKRKPPKANGGSRRQKRKRPVAVELINDTDPKSSIRESVGHDELLGSRPRLNKMSMSLAMDEMKEELDLGVARSERAKGPEKGLFDEMIETKSVKPILKPPQFGLQSKGDLVAPINEIFKPAHDDSGIAIINQTKNSIQSIEHMQRLLTKPSPDSKGLDAPHSFELNEVIDLNRESISVSNCPSISSKAFMSKANESMRGGLNGKSNFLEIEKEMQDLRDQMRETQSTGELEEKLRKWHRDLKNKPDFKFIVGTNIGRHLSSMRNFCKDRLKETDYYQTVLGKIKNFENIIISRISDTFFGCEDSINMARDFASSFQNPSPASKDLTLFNQSFPSPRYDPRPKFVLGPHIPGRRKSNIRRAFQATHQEPSNSQMGPKSSKPGEILEFDNFDKSFMTSAVVKDFQLNKTFDIGQLGRVSSVRSRLNKSLYSKKEQTMDVEDSSVVTMKKDADTKIHWNTDNVIGLDTQRRVASKIAKKLFRIEGVPQMKSGTVEKLGRIIEKTIRKESLDKDEYQKQVLQILQAIDQSGKEFYYKFLSQNRRKCDVYKLKMLLLQQMRTN